MKQDRLILRWLTIEDSGFMLELMNDPSWLQYIGDRGVRTLEDASNYILSGPVDMYNRLGFGLYLCELKESGLPMGICGLIKRDSLEDVDIGYAFLPRYSGQGYAYESASAVVAYAKHGLGLDRIVAITSSNNWRSAKLLQKLGLQFERMISSTSDEQEIKLFGSAL